MVSGNASVVWMREIEGEEWDLPVKYAFEIYDQSGR